MEIWRDDVAILQAQLAVQQLVLRVLVQSHPQPGVLLQRWRQLRADHVAASYGLPRDARTSDWLSEHIQTFAEDWTAELEDEATRRAAGLEVPYTDPGASTHP